MRLCHFFEYRFSIESGHYSLRAHERRATPTWKRLLHGVRCEHDDPKRTVTRARSATSSCPRDDEHLSLGHKGGMPLARLLSRHLLREIEPGIDHGIRV